MTHTIAGRQDCFSLIAMPVFGRLFDGYLYTEPFLIAAAISVFGYL
jgi:hypothetical protein